MAFFNFKSRAADTDSTSTATSKVAGDDGLGLPGNALTRTVARFFGGLQRDVMHSPETGISVSDDAVLDQSFMGLKIALSSCLSAMCGYMAGHKAFEGSPVAATILSVIMGSAVFLVDRHLLVSMRRGAKANIPMVAVRIVYSVSTAAAIGFFANLVIWNGDIQERLRHEREAAISAVAGDAKIARGEFMELKAAEDAKVAEVQAKVDAAHANVACEKEGKCGTGVIGAGPASRERARMLADAKQELADAKRSRDEVLKSSPAAIGYQQAESEAVRRNKQEATVWRDSLAKNFSILKDLKNENPWPMFAVGSLLFMMEMLAVVAILTKGENEASVVDANFWAFKVEQVKTKTQAALVNMWNTEGRESAQMAAQVREARSLLAYNEQQTHIKRAEEISLAKVSSENVVVRATLEHQRELADLRLQIASTTVGVHEAEQKAAELLLEIAKLQKEKDDLLKKPAFTTYKKTGADGYKGSSDPEEFSA